MTLSFKSLVECLRAGVYAKFLKEPKQIAVQLSCNLNENTLSTL